MTKKFQNSPFLWWILDHYLIHDSFGPPNSPSQTAAWSVQPFLHGRFCIFLIRKIAPSHFLPPDLPLADSISVLLDSGHYVQKCIVWEGGRGRWKCGSEKCRSISWGRKCRSDDVHVWKVVKTENSKRLFYECLLEQSGIRWSLNDDYEQRSGVHIHYNSP